MSLPPVMDWEDYDPATLVGVPTTPLTAAMLELAQTMLLDRVGAMITAAVGGGASGTSPLAVYAWSSVTGWPTLPVTAPAGIALVMVVGPAAADAPPAAPTWVGWGTGQVPMLTLAVPA